MQIWLFYWGKVGKLCQSVAFISKPAMAMKIEIEVNSIINKFCRRSLHRAIRILWAYVFSNSSQLAVLRRNRFQTDYEEDMSVARKCFQAILLPILTTEENTLLIQFKIHKFKPNAYKNIYWKSYLMISKVLVF